MRPVLPQGNRPAPNISDSGALPLCTWVVNTTTERALARAPERMRRNNEAQHPVDLAMNGLRQRAFLNPPSRGVGTRPRLIVA